MDFEQHVNDTAKRGRQNFLENLKDPLFGMEAENLFLIDDSRFIENYSAADNKSYTETLEELAKDENAILHEEPGKENMAKAVEFDGPYMKEGIGQPAFTFDYGPQGEVESQPMKNLDDLARQKNNIEKLAQEAAPEGTDFYQMALLPNLTLIDEEFNDVITWDMDEDADTDLYRNPLLRYGNIEETYGKPGIIMGGAGGLQISGVPSETSVSLDDVDDVITNFQKGKGEKPGIPAMNPIFYSLTETGPVISEDGRRKFHGRDDTYWHRHARSPHIDRKTGENKYGYTEDIIEADSLEEIVAANSERLLEYSASAPLEALQPIDGGREYQDREEFEHYNPEDEFPIVMIGDGLEERTHRDIVETEEINGYIRLEDSNGEENREYINLDINNMEYPEEFLWDNYLQAESMNKPNIRPRMGFGCLENRDQDNTPKWLPALGIQASKHRNWKKFQEAAYNEGFTNQDHEYLKEQHQKHGLNAKLHPGTEMTIKDFTTEYEDLFTEKLHEKQTSQATEYHLNQIINDHPTEAEKIMQNYTEEQGIDEFMKYAKVS